MKAVLALIVLVVAGCAHEPEPFVFGSDQDAFCRMAISDARFAGQIVMNTGKAYKFDSVECLAGFLAAGSIDEADVANIWVSDYALGGGLMPAQDAVFVKSSLMRSPMGAGLAAFGPSINPRAVTDSFGGELLTWDEVRDQYGPDRPSMP